jgi:hypothetical protein
MRYFALRAFRFLVTFSFPPLLFLEAISRRFSFPPLLFLKAISGWSDSALSPILTSCTLLRSLFRNLSLFPPLLPICTGPFPFFVPLFVPVQCLPHFLRSVPSVSSPLHFLRCFWIFFSHPPSSLPNFLLLFLLFSR